MSDKKISELTSIDDVTLDDADLIPVVDTSATETKQISVADLKAAVGGGGGPIQAWVNFVGSSASILSSSGNITVARNSAGDYTCTMSPARADANYLVMVQLGLRASGGRNFMIAGIHTQSGGTAQAPSTSAFRFACVQADLSNYYDPDFVMVLVVGN